MSLNEFDIIQRFFSGLTGKRPDTLIGIGDDCALLQPPAGKLLAVSTDTLVAGRHFPAQTSAQDIGYKSLAVNLSDLAAMGAEPAWVSLSLTLPEAEEDWLAGFSRGFAELANEFQLELIGGDITRGPLSISVTIHGFVAPEKSMTRSGANVGDIVCVSGSLGEAALALGRLADGQSISDNLLNRLNRPSPRVNLGMQLTGLATSCIDISDGLVADLGHICDASACQAEINLQQLPCSTDVYDEIQQSQSWDIVLAGGDDYELCFTVSPASRWQLAEISNQTGLQITEIGEMKTGSGVSCLNQKGQPVPLNLTGFKHFS